MDVIVAVARVGVFLSGPVRRIMFGLLGRG